jgi:superfamily I DNA/RNA helicase
MMLGKGINDRVHVYHFHDWCGEQLSRYHVAKPDRGKHYLDDLVPTVMAAVDRGRIPRGQYGALLIDEGHDFEEEWLRLVVQMVDPDEGSLLLLYDDAQSIYKKKSTMNFSLSSVGIQARGRTTILKLNYRNTSEILEFAYRFAGHYLSPKDSDEDHAPLIEPQSVGRHGPAPYLKICKSKQEEAGYIAHTLTRLHKDGVPWGDMCVACHSRRLAQQVADALEPGTIPVQCVVDAADKRAFDPTRDSVKVMTMHSSKGLEFPLVVIPDVGKMPRPSMEPSEEAKLLYVAMTRSTDKLLLTACNSSEFVELLLE